MPCFSLERGHAVCGLDYVAVAIERAKAKASGRKIAAEFVVGDALELARLRRQFDTVLDCGLFHTFSDEERAKFVRGLAAVLRPKGLLHILCFSDAEPPGEGPRRVTEAEIRGTFASGWAVRADSDAIRSQRSSRRSAIQPRRPESLARDPGATINSGDALRQIAGGVERQIAESCENLQVLATLGLR